MSKWKVPTGEQAEMAVALGLDPDGIAISETGDTYTILHFKSGAMYYIGSEWIIGTDRTGKEFFSRRKQQALKEMGGNHGRQKQTEMPTLRGGAGTARFL